MKRKHWRRIGLGLLAVLLILIIVYRDLISYGLGQAKGQYTIIRNARPVAEVMADPATPDSIRQQLKLVEEVRNYAMNTLQLHQSDNYTTYYDQQGRELMFVVTACEPFALQPKKWQFPIIGSFPYKGFFDSTKAQKEANIWRNQGYDVRVRTAGGWSTLGYFKDPILSNMLDRSEGGIADLIIHELTHATVFVKDSVEFNENLATFIGERGAEQFLVEKYGPDSDQLNAYIAGRENGRIFADHILRGAQQLDQFYQNLDPALDSTAKATQKWALIKEIAATIDTLSFLGGDARYGTVFENQLPNNAYFMSFLRYRQGQSTLETWFQEEYQGDLQALLADMKRRYPSL